MCDIAIISIVALFVVYLMIKHKKSVVSKKVLK
jgi:hypothetical protein